MSDTGNPDAIDPMALWRSFQDANLEIWAKGMASLVNTDAYAQAMRSFLDSYLSTSAPFRKIMDQYMGFWLSSLNMPSRDEIVRLEQRLATSEMRLNGLYGQIDQLLQAMHTQTGQVISFAGEQRTLVEHLEAHTQSLDSKTDTMQQTIQQEISRITTMNSEQMDAYKKVIEEKLATIQTGDTSGYEDRMQSLLDASTEQMTQIIKEQTARTSDSVNAQNTRMGELESRMESLDAVTDQILQVLQDQREQKSTPPATPSDTQQARITEVETRIQALDEKTGQVLEALQAIHETLQKPKKTTSSRSKTSRSTSTRKASSKKADEEAQADKKSE